MKTKKHRKQAKREVLTHYSTEEFPMCEKCGETGISKLSINHINGGGGVHRRSIKTHSGIPFYFWLIKNNFPKGYNVLCIPCNAKDGRERINDKD